MLSHNIPPLRVALLLQVAKILSNFVEIKHNIVCHLSPKSWKIGVSDSFSSRTRDSGCPKIMGDPPEVQEVDEGWGERDALALDFD